MPIAVAMLHTSLIVAPCHATGGLPYYNALWGPGIKFAMDAINKNDDSTGRNYYKNMKGEEYKYDIGNSDLAFGQQVFYHIK